MVEKKSAKKPETKPKEAEVKVSGKKTQDKKSKKGWIWGIICGVAVIAIAAIVAVVLNLKPTDPSDPTARIAYSKAFFIYDKKYTLWDADGKRLTEDEYSDTSSFVGGYAYVKKDDQVGVIHDDGKMSVEFGKYGSITTQGGLFLAQDGNTKEYSLITGAGKELVKGSELTVVAPSAASGFAVVESDTAITAYNYAGNLIFEISAADDADSPVMNNLNDFGVVYYANHNYVFDVRDGRMIADFEGARFSFEEVSTDRKMILLENYNDSGDYRLITSDKVYTLNQMEYYGFTAQNQLIGYTSSSKIGLLNNNFEIIKEISSYVQLKDSYTYAVEEGNAVAIYQNGEKVKEFSDAEVTSGGILYENYYAIEADDKVVFYNLDGTAAFNREFVYGTIFNRHHAAVVAEAEGERYLMDARGNRITDYTAKSFSVREGGYEVENGEGKYAIADKAGKLVSDFVYDDLYYRSSAEPRNIWSAKKGQKSYDVINADDGKVVASDINVYDFSANYFVAKNDEGKKVYYTYTGENFYTES